MSVRDTQQWLFGDMAQRERSEDCARSGEAVVPIFNAEHIVDSVAAPMIMAGGGLLVSADLIVFGRTGVRHEEVKAKSRPGFLRWKRIWTHGMDFVLFEQYCKLEEHSRVPVFVLVREKKSPEDPSRESSLYTRMTPLWLIASLTHIRINGHVARNWPRPGNEGSRSLRGGWCWDRSIMQQLDPSIQAGQVAALHQRLIDTEEQLRALFVGASSGGK